MWLDVRVHKEARQYRPYLDGEELKHCFAANEEEGWVDMYCTDENGKFIIEKELNEEILKTQRLFGKIELRKITNV